MIYLNSVQKESSKTDGIRICIMRKPGPGVQFDIWMPTLSPSLELLTNYHKEKVTWEEFEVLFTKEVLHPDNPFLHILIDLSKKHTITLLCWEETSEKCHRRLVAEYLKKLEPTLQIENK